MEVIRWQAPEYWAIHPTRSVLRAGESATFRTTAGLEEVHWQLEYVHLGCSLRIASKVGTLAHLQVPADACASGIYFLKATRLLQPEKTITSLVWVDPRTPELAGAGTEGHDLAGSPFPLEKPLLDVDVILAQMDQPLEPTGLLRLA